MRDEQLLVSVVVPVYNVKNWLGGCIESVLKQSYARIELILVDDGSTDGSGEVCDEYAARDERARVKHTKQLGVSHARNVGLKLARGRYVTFVDGDDEIDSEYVAKLVELDGCANGKMRGVKSGRDGAVAQGGESGAVARVRYVKMPSGRIYKADALDEATTTEYIRGILERDVLGTCCGFLFRKEWLAGLKFDETSHYMEDSTFVVDYLARVERVALVEGAPLYIYHEHADSATSNDKHVEHLAGYEYSLNQIDQKTKRRFHKQVSIKFVRLARGEILSTRRRPEISEMVNFLQKDKLFKAAEPVTLEDKIFRHLVVRGNVFSLWVLAGVKGWLNR